MTAAEAAPRPTVDQFARFCSLLLLEDGARMVLEDFQAAALEDYFAGATETFVILPKKNGKTTLLAALALMHMAVTEDAMCPIGASSRDQASIIYEQAIGLIRRSPKVRDLYVVKTGFREIRSAIDQGRIRVLAADAGTADGVIPTLALVDELHRHRTPELFGVFRDGLGPRNGQIVSISTAGEDEESPLGLIRSRAYRLPYQDRDGAHRVCRDDSRSFVLHEWALDEAEPRDDMTVVKRANPASWQTPARLQERFASPSTSSAQWARFACGVWLRAEDRAVQATDWDALANPLATIPAGSPVYVGWDQAWRGPDVTALVPLWWQSPERRVVGDPIVLDPAASDGMLDDRDVLAALLSLRDRYRVLAVVYDPNAGAAALAQQVSREHSMVLVEHSQTDAPMALADGRLVEALRRRELVHTGHPTLRSHVLNAVEKPVAGGSRFRLIRPSRGPRKAIDCLTALSIAHSVAVADATNTKSRDWYLI